MVHSFDDYSNFLMLLELNPPLPAPVNTKYPPKLCEHSTTLRREIPGPDPIENPEKMQLATVPHDFQLRFSPASSPCSIQFGIWKLKNIA